MNRLLQRFRTMLNGLYLVGERKHPVPRGVSRTSRLLAHQSRQLTWLISTSVTYEQSLLPFLYPARQDLDDEPPVRNSGRRTFKNGKEVDARTFTLAQQLF